MFSFQHDIDQDKYSTGKKPANYGTRLTGNKERKVSDEYDDEDDSHSSMGNEGEIHSESNDMEEPDFDDVMKVNNRHNTGLSNVVNPLGFKTAAPVNPAGSKRSSVGSVNHFAFQNGVGEASREEAGRARRGQTIDEIDSIEDDED